MNEIVENLKSQREQSEYKLEQYENLIKCQRLEIESKSSLVRQFELVSTTRVGTCSFRFGESHQRCAFCEQRIQDSSNELENLKTERLRNSENK